MYSNFERRTDIRTYEEKKNLYSGVSQTVGRDFFALLIALLFSCGPFSNPFATCSSQRSRLLLNLSELVTLKAMRINTGFLMG